MASGGSNFNQGPAFGPGGFGEGNWQYPLNNFGGFNRGAPFQYGRRGGGRRGGSQWRVGGNHWRGRSGPPNQNMGYYYQDYMESSDYSFNGNYQRGHRRGRGQGRGFGRMATEQDFPSEEGSVTSRKANRNAWYKRKSFLVKKLNKKLKKVNEGEKSTEPAGPRLSRKQRSDIRYKITMSKKSKFRSVRQNRYLDREGQFLLTFLKRICFDICKDDNMEHCLQFSKVVSRHKNAIKLFAYECKQQLDKKFGVAQTDESKQKLLEYLKEIKKEIIEDYQRVYKRRAAEEDMSVYEAKLDEYIEILSNDLADEHIPVPEDYLYNPEENKTEEDFINDFKSEFYWSCYQVFQYKPDELKATTKNIEKRAKFHLDNPIMGFFLVESVRKNGKVNILPSPINKYIFIQSEVYQEKNTASHNYVYEIMSKSNEQVQTPVSKYIENESDVGEDIYRTFKQCLESFDKLATYIKFRLYKYTPHILLPPEQKDQLFNEFVDKIYRDVLHILKNNEKFLDYQFTDMEKDEIKEEPTADVKEEPAIPMQTE